MIALPVKLQVTVVVMTLMVTVVMVMMVVNLKVVLTVSGSVQMAVAYLQATIVMVPLKTAMLDGDLTVLMALMKY
jgi:hypothetical protein